MSHLQIEKGIPVPNDTIKSKSKGLRSNKRWPWVAMAVGDSVVVPLGEWPQGQNALHAVVHRTGKTFEWLKSGFHVRVWCTFDPEREATKRVEWPWRRLPVGGGVKVPAKLIERGKMACRNYMARHPGIEFEWRMGEDCAWVKRTK